MTTLFIDRREVMKAACRLSFLLAACLTISHTVSATSVIPITDRALYLRADVIVHGVVSSSDLSVDDQGRPEMLTVIQPLEVLKGQLSGSLVVHQLGGLLPDGRSLKIWGRPEYKPGREVVVFAIARSTGEYETAELMLGKFEVWQDELGTRFAIPDLAAGVHPGVDVHDPAATPKAVGLDRQSSAVDAGAAIAPEIESVENATRPRELAPYLAALRHGAQQIPLGTPTGELSPVDYSEGQRNHPKPLWGNINNSLWRWNNNATAAWTFNGAANIDGNGTAEATAALASWTTYPNSSIGYTAGSGTSNVIYLNATSSALGCGWSTCLAGGGVIGCGGPSGGGNNSWRGDNYITILGGTVELRAYCNHNGFDSITTQAVLTHELGHTLGLGHSDQNFSAHDTCSGDESAATMRSVVQHSTPLGTDDQDAIRWIYGDGGNSCSLATTPTVTSLTASPTLPQQFGTAITWTANATGGVAPLQYRFWEYNSATGVQTMVRDYSTTNTYSWTPTGSNVGDHRIIVWVRNASSSNPYDGSFVGPTFTITGTTPTVTSLMASPALPQPAGTPITWTVTATGGVAPLQYRFWEYNSATGVQTMVRDYSTTNTYSWTPTGSNVGDHRIIVWVRNASSSNPYDGSFVGPTFTITSTTPTVTSLIASPALPQPTGVQITWTATATGGIAPLQYRFWEYNSATGVQTMVRDYSTSNTYSWTPTPSNVGSHRIIVWVRNAGSSAAYDTYSVGPTFTITSAPPTVTSLIASPALPQPAGTQITWTVTATGGVAPLQYRFWEYNSASGVQTIVRDYSTTNTYSWTPTPANAGSHRIIVWVRNAGSSNSYDAYYVGVTFQITP